MWGGDEPSLPLVLGGGGSSPHLHMLVDLLELVTQPSDSVSWRLWAVGAIDNGGNGDMAVGTGVVDRCHGQWWWLRTEVGDVAPASNVSKKMWDRRLTLINRQ